MKYRFYTIFAITILAFLPVVAFAQKVPHPVFITIFDITQRLIILLIGLAVLVFLWGVLKFFISKSDAGKENGRTYILWGIVALAVMVFVWGFVALLSNAILGSAGSDIGLLSQETNSLQTAPTENQPGSFGSKGTVQGSTSVLVESIAALIPYMLVLGVLIFIWGIFNYIREENVQKKAQASMFMGWGLFLLFVMAFMWVLVIMIGDTVNINVRNDLDPTSASPINPSNLIKKP